MNHPRVVAVVGGASSVGRAVAERFAGRGEAVFVADVDPDAVRSANCITGVSAAVVDATDPAALAAWFGQVLGAVGRVDVLVNTVGLPGPRAPVEAVADEDWDKTLRGSVGAAFVAIRAVVPGMKSAGGGTIVNFSSASTRALLPLRTPYVVAKFAVEGLTRNLARELGPYGIRVNAILPGAIDNDRLRRIFADSAVARGITAEAVETQTLRYISMRSKIGLDELAAMVDFLASPAAPHVTGQLIGVDGNVEWEE